MSLFSVDALFYWSEQKESFSFEIERSFCAGMTGPSGSGKTLLLRALADLDPHQGRVFLNGRECSNWSAPDWRRRVAMLPAESQWWLPTVGEHFDEIDENLFQQMGFNRDTLSWGISRLSSGERQRLALLRLLTNMPPVLLLDEPTRSLDPENVDRVESLIAGYRERTQAAVLWITHDDNQAKRVAQTRFYLKDGYLEEKSEQ